MLTTAKKVLTLLRLRPRRAPTVGTRAPIDAEVVRWLKGDATQGKASIVKLGVDFYLLNYLLSTVLPRGSKADPRVAAWHLEITSVRRAAIAWLDKFFFTYLCAATAGELRHAPGAANVVDSHTARLTYWKIVGTSRDRWQVQKEFLTMLNDANVHEYLSDAVAIFGVHWHRGGFGGPKWQIIAETGRERLHERITPVVFIDRVFDLRHNGGPMFDKNPAVEQDNIVAFLNAKAALTTDAEWGRWLPFASPRVLQLLRIGNLLGLWQGKTPDPNAKPPSEDEEEQVRCAIPRHAAHTKPQWPKVVACEGGTKS